MAGRMKQMHQKLSAPFVSRRGGRSKDTPFNEGVQVPQAEFDRLAEKNPALKSKNRLERSEALTKEIKHGELAKFRRR